MQIGKRLGQFVLYTRPSEAGLPLGVGGVAFLSNVLGERLQQLQERGQHHLVTCGFSGATRRGCVAPALCTQLAHTFALSLTTLVGSVIC